MSGKCCLVCKVISLSCFLFLRIDQGRRSSPGASCLRLYISEVQELVNIKRRQQAAACIYILLLYQYPISIKLFLIFWPGLFKHLTVAYAKVQCRRRQMDHHQIPSIITLSGVSQNLTLTRYILLWTRNVQGEIW